MKKLLIIAVLAGAALAGCTMDEMGDGFNDGRRDLITFTTPVLGTFTKGGDDPDSGPVDGTTYPESEWFHVFAVKTAGDYAGTEDWSEKYMDADVYRHNVDGKKYWDSDDDYYWPNDGKLTFAAYSPAKMDPQPTYDGTGLKIVNFKTPQIYRQYDLMYAPRVFNKDETMVDYPLTGSGDPNTTYHGVSVTFKHALSKIMFFVKSLPGFHNITLKEITITGVYDQGTFEENITNGSSYESAPEWNSRAYQNGQTSVFTLSGASVSTSISEDFEQVGRSLLMIPQTIPEAAEITIKWTSAGKLSSYDNTTTIKLNTIVSKWEINKCYKYNITIDPFQMVHVKGGTFMMKDQEVTLSDYYIGKYEVTQGLWKAVMGADKGIEHYCHLAGYDPDAGLLGDPSDGDNYPMYWVSYNDIVDDFLPKLREMTGRNFWLPTEAQWEFAARGGNNSEGYKYSGSDNIYDVAWMDTGKLPVFPFTPIPYPDGKIHPVGGKQPNELGIYDMSGNVCEWCHDWYGKIGEEHVRNPEGPSSGSERILRGGGCSSSLDNNWDEFRVDVRNRLPPDSRGHIGSEVCGFRLALEPLSEPEMIFVEGGTFLMGAQTEHGKPNYESVAEPDESPVHKVTLSDYYIGKYEVTQGLWKAVMGKNKDVRYYCKLAGFNPDTDLHGEGNDYPMYYVSWEDIYGSLIMYTNYGEILYKYKGGFLEKLSQMTGKNYCLPTEAQWEFAAAGGKAGYNEDGSRKHPYSGSDILDDVGWYGGYIFDYENNDGVPGNSENTSHPVGEKNPNELGIHDMTGNIEEWCYDYYNEDENYYQKCVDQNIVKDPVSSWFVQGFVGRRVFRGGCWYYGISGAWRVANRRYDDADRRNYKEGDEIGLGVGYGFRLALPPP